MLAHARQPSKHPKPMYKKQLNTPKGHLAHRAGGRQGLLHTPGRREARWRPAPPVTHSLPGRLAQCSRPAHTGVRRPCVHIYMAKEAGNATFLRPLAPPCGGGDPRKYSRTSAIPAYRNAVGKVGGGGEGGGGVGDAGCVHVHMHAGGGGRRPAPWATLAIGEMSQHSACAAQRWAPLETDTGIWAGRGGAGGLRGSIAWRWQ